jgi:hypothetical protein
MYGRKSGSGFKNSQDACVELWALLYMNWNNIVRPEVCFDERMRNAICVLIQSFERPSRLLAIREQEV